MNKKATERYYKQIAENHGFNNEHDFLFEMYWTQNKKPIEIGKMVNRDPNTVRARLKKLKIKMKPKGGDNRQSDKKIKEICHRPGCDNQRGKNLRYLCPDCFENSNLYTDKYEINLDGLK